MEATIKAVVETTEGVALAGVIRRRDGAGLFVADRHRGSLIVRFAEAVTAEGLPRHLGTLHGRRVRHLLHRLAAPVEEHVLGFPGASAPYWEFRGFRPSLALIVPGKGPVLFRRLGDRSVWVRFGWGRSDNWLPVEDPRAERALDVARTDAARSFP